MTLDEQLRSVIFRFLPNRDGFSAEPVKSSYKSVQTSNGFDRERRDHPYVAFLATCSFTLDLRSKNPGKAQNTSYDDFMAFYERFKKEPKWFTMLLPYDILDIDSKLTKYYASFVPDTFQMGSFSYYNAVASIQIEATQKLPRTLGVSVAEA